MSKPIACGCGRSPTGLCLGFHVLSEDEWAGGRLQLEHIIKAGQQNPHAADIVKEDSNDNMA